MSQLLIGVVLSLPLIGAYAILALGIVLIYRASKVLNLAHGMMATVPAYVLFSLHGLGLPLVVSLPLAIASGGALGYLVDRVFVRPFRRQGETAQTVGTVVVLGFGIALLARIYGSTAVPAVDVMPTGAVNVGLSNVRFSEMGLFVSMLVVFAALTALFRFTDLGLLLRGSAENPTAAALHGVNPQRMTALTWIIGGMLAAVAGIQLSAITVLEPFITPLQVLPAFVAALIGGLGSVNGTLAGSAIVGVVIGLVPFVPVFDSTQGAAQLLLAVVALIVMAARGDKLAAGQPASSGVL
jgi:branched-chain amino acid transport system permease protein